MLEEGMKLLGPWPILQFMFGLAVLAGGVYMISRGLAKKDEPRLTLEDRRQEWAAYEQLKNIEENTFKLVNNQQALTDAINRLSSVMWNREQR